MNKKHNVGGQAVIEGVMMRGSKGIATAVRKTDCEIVLDIKEVTPYSKRNCLFRLPIIRGFIILIESMVIGIKSLNYSASLFEDDEEYEPSRFEKWLEGVFKEKSGDIIIGITLLFSFALAALLFFILPTYSANFFKFLGIKSTVILNVFEGIIRVGIFLTYIYIIGKMEDIQRVFQYHGAEHKVIFCYESEEELTVENAKKFERLHPRCGTNFMFLVMIVSIIVFSMTGWETLLQRIAWRITLLPIVSGVTYEIIKWMGKSEGYLSKIFSYPGLMLQKLTTKEPDEEQLEVAIKALKAAEGMEDKNEYNSTIVN